MAVILHRSEKIAKKYLKCAPETKSPRKNGVSEKNKIFFAKKRYFFLSYDIIQCMVSTKSYRILQTDEWRRKTNEDDVVWGR